LSIEEWRGILETETETATERKRNKERVVYQASNMIADPKSV
jgi:hypothetical protein